jgi:hypothetical protein
VILADEDEQILRACLAWADDEERELTEYEEKWRGAFEQMLERNRALTPAQKQWLRRVHEQVTGTPSYENAWSAGRVPRGEALAMPVPEVLRKPLPMKPPGRR